MTHRSPRRFVTVLLTVAAATVALAQPASAAPYTFAGPVFGLAARPGGSSFGSHRRRRGDRSTPGRRRGARGRPAPRHGHRSRAHRSDVGDRGEEALQRQRRPREATLPGRARQVRADREPRWRRGRLEPVRRDHVGHQARADRRRGRQCRARGEPAGRRQLIATLPDELVPTDNVKALSGCPAGPAEICDSAGRDPRARRGHECRDRSGRRVLRLGARGFPAPRGCRASGDRARRASRALRPGCERRPLHDGRGRLHVDRRPDVRPDGTAYVTELDEASWFAVEVATDKAEGGTVNTCDPTTWTCTETPPD